MIIININHDSYEIEWSLFVIEEKEWNIIGQFLHHYNPFYHKGETNMNILYEFAKIINKNPSKELIDFVNNLENGKDFINAIYKILKGDDWVEFLESKYDVKGIDETEINEKWIIDENNPLYKVDEEYFKLNQHIIQNKDKYKRNVVMKNKIISIDSDDDDISLKNTVKLQEYIYVKDLYDKNKYIIAKKVNNKTQLLTKEEIDDLIKNDKKVHHCIKNYFNVDCKEKCVQCKKNDTEFIFVWNSNDYWPKFNIGSFCMYCYCHNLDSFGCGGCQFLYTLAKVKNGWVNIDDHKLPEEKTCLYDAHWNVLNNRYWSDFKIVINDDINVVQFIKNKFTSIYEETLLEHINDYKN